AFMGILGEYQKDESALGSPFPALENTVRQYVNRIKHETPQPGEPGPTINQSLTKETYNAEWHKEVIDQTNILGIIFVRFQDLEAGFLKQLFPLFQRMEMVVLPEFIEESTISSSSVIQF